MPYPLPIRHLGGIKMIRNITAKAREVLAANSTKSLSGASLDQRQRRQ
jgi:hypothetical protein